MKPARGHPGPPRPGGIGAWILAARPRTLTAAVVPVLVGTGLAFHERSFAMWPALAALLGAVLIQVGTNLANDYFDHKKGADAGRRGPTRVTQAGLVTEGQMRRAIVVAFTGAILCGIYLAAIGGWPIVVIGLLSILSGLAYTGGPYPLGYHGLGDLFVFVFFGIVAVAGSFYVQSHRLTPLALWAAVPVGLLSVAILTVNNIRDIESDRTAGKRTLVVRWGRGFGIAEYTFCIALAFAVPVVLVASRRLSPWGLLPLIASPLAPPLLQRVASSADPVELVRCLGATSRLLLLYGLLFAVGVAL